MGIPIVPPEKIGVGGCSTCFAGGETPRFLYVEIAGNGTGVNWFEDLGQPINGIFKVEHSVGCTWLKNAGLWTVSYIGGPSGSKVEARYAPLFDGVEGVSLDNCHSWFDLQIRQPDFGHWTGGFALVTMVDDCPIISMLGLAESVGLSPGPDLLADPFVTPNEEGVIRYARKRDATNVKIKIDCS